MNKLLWKCPVCEQELRVTGLECSHCGTEIRGHFALGRFARLGTDDLHFVEIFVKNRGNAYRVAEELEIPYSGVRARLTEIIQALGYEDDISVREESALPPERRKAILDQVSSGKLSSEQAIKLLQGENAV
jgi:hypothetical protein